ncbi:MAG: M28 family peptidase [Coprothermobacterota bacterium]|nr:M28 family peptidase [Coprothermobacterota bacterium]
MKNSIDFLRELCAFPHRGSATEEERKAASLIRGKLEEFGYKVIVQEFHATRDNFYLLPVQVLFLAIVAGLLSLFSSLSWLSLLLLVYGLALLFLEVSGFDIDLTVMPRFKSQNIYTLPDKLPSKLVIVSAHYDTQRGSFIFHPSFIDRIPLLFGVSYLSVGLMLLGVILRFFSLVSSSFWLLSIGAALSFLVFLVFLFAWITGRYTQGANDNGSGTALALFLAQDYKMNRADYPSDTEVLFLFTGNEEGGTKGMKAFLRKMSQELPRDATKFIVLDNLGTGKVTFLAGEGMILYRKAGKELLEVARELKKTFPVEIQEQKNLLLPTDSLPVATKGFQTISFLGKDEKGRLGNYHYFTDVFENVDQDFLRLEENFFKEYLKRVTSLK